MSTTYNQESTPKPTGKRAMLAAALGAVAVAVMTLTATAAHADPEGDCIAKGGTYSQGTDKYGNVIETCCVKNPNGTQTCDNYENGNKYVGTGTAQNPSGTGPSPTSLRPPAPGPAPLPAHP